VIGPDDREDECVSCETVGTTDGLCDECQATISIAGNHTTGCRCGICTLAAAAQWAQRDARGAW
jgi:hypothetical protein